MDTVDIDAGMIEDAIAAILDAEKVLAIMREMVGLTDH